MSLTRMRLDRCRLMGVILGVSSWILLSGFSSPPPLPIDSGQTARTTPIVFSIKALENSFLVNLSLLNQIADGPQKQQLITQTFVSHVNDVPLDELTVYLKQLHQQSPLLSRNVISLMVIEMHRHEIASSKRNQLIDMLPVQTDRDYIKEAFLNYLIDQGDFDYVRSQLDQWQDNPLAMSRILENLVVSQLKRDYTIDTAPFVDQIASQFEKETLYGAIAKVYAQHGRYTQTINTIQLIESQRLKDTVLFDTSVSFVQSLEFDAALQLVNQIENASIYNEAITELSMGYARSSKFDSAFQLIGSIQSPYLRSKALVFLGRQLLEISEQDDAISLLSEISNPQFHDELVDAIVLSYAKQGDNENAFAFINELKQPKSRDALTIKLADALGMQKNYHYQLLLLKQLTPESLRNDAISQFTTTYMNTHPLSRSWPLIKDYEEALKQKYYYPLGVRFVNAGEFEMVIELTDRLKTDVKKREFLIHAILNSEPDSIDATTLETMNNLVNRLNLPELSLLAVKITLQSWHQDEAQTVALIKQVPDTQLVSSETDIAQQIYTKIAFTATQFSEYEVALQVVPKLTSIPDKIRVLNQIRLSGNLSTKHDIKL